MEEQDESEREEEETASSTGLGTVVSVRKFLQSWDAEVTALSQPIPERKNIVYIAGQMGIPTDLAEELSNVCSMDTLKCGDEPADKDDLLKMKGLPKDLDLTCVKYQERDLERRKMVDYKLFVMNKMKYRVLDVVQVPQSQNEIAPDKKVLHPNVVLTVKVYRQRTKAAILPKGEVFLVLGTQSLTDLKDNIACVKDDAVAGDFSDVPHISNEGLTPAKHTYKSGMLFIENTFYNDMREADNRDYSEPILKWAKENDHESYPEFRKAKMEDTLFVDLNIQLGVPYLYQHQGNCEHVIVFTDLRLLHCDDPQDVTMYPFLLSETVTRRIICRSCSMDSAKWVVHDSQLTPESPCYMCHSCFTLLHYDQNGHKICNFKAYKYRQKTGPS